MQRLDHLRVCECGGYHIRGRSRAHVTSVCNVQQKQPYLGINVATFSSRGIGHDYGLGRNRAEDGIRGYV